MGALRLTDEQYNRLQAKAKPKKVDETAKLHKKPVDVSADLHKPEYESWLENQLVAVGVLGIEREYLWCRGRKFRADLAIPERMLIVEIQGEVHRVKKMFKSDLDKAQQAILQGWTLLPVSTKQVRDGEAASLVRQVLSLLMAKATPF